MNTHLIKHPKIIFAASKYAFGDVKRDFSTEYQSFFYALKKRYKSIHYFNTYNKTQSIKNINKKFLKYCIKNKPDYIFMSLATYEIYIETLVQIKNELNTVLINWCSDDSWRFEQHSGIYAPYFDVNITTDFDAYNKFKKFKTFPILSNWGCPDQWLTSVKPEKKCKFDVIFIGSSYMGRKKIINYLEDSGIKVQCFGHGWQNGSVKSKKIPNLMNNAKICLNFSKSRGVKRQLKARPFEITGCGSLCLTEDSPQLGKFFNKSKDIITFSSKKDLKNKIKYLLKNKDKRDKIAKNGFLKCKNNYIYSHIIDAIFNKILEHKFSKKKYKEIKTNPNTFIFPKLIKNILFFLFILFVGRTKSLKIVRRFFFEIEWRFRKKHIYSKSGWTSNLFNLI